jgi:hypothetical protein
MADRASRRFQAGRRLTSFTTGSTVTALIPAGHLPGHSSDKGPR